MSLLGIVDSFFQLGRITPHRSKKNSHVIFVPKVISEHGSHLAVVELDVDGRVNKSCHSSSFCRWWHLGNDNYIRVISSQMSFVPVLP